MSDNKRIAKNTIYLYIRMAFIMGVTLYTSRIILKILGAQDFGIYNVVGGIVSMFSFLNGALGGASSRYITYELGKKRYNRLNKVFNVALFIHITLAIIVVLLGETIGLWFFYEKMIIPEDRMNAAFWVYQISILTSVFSLTQVPYNATIIAYENMSIYAYVGIIEAILRLLVVFLLLISPIDLLIFYAILLLVIQVAIMLFYRAYCNKHYGCCKIKIYNDYTLFKEMFNYAGADFIGSLAVMAQGQGFNLLLNLFFGPLVNAARAIAYQIQGAVTQFSNNFMTAVRPQIIKLYAEGRINDMMKLVVSSSCFSYYLMWIISFPFCLEIDYILSLWLGKFPKHTSSFAVLTIILCLIQTVKTPRTIVFHATGKLKVVNFTVGLILCSAFPLAYLFLKIGGNAESVFWAANITMAFSEIVSIRILKMFVKFSALRYTLLVHVRCLLVSLISFVLPYYLYDKFLPPSFLRLIMTISITLISTLTTVWFVGLNNDMRQNVKTIIKSKLYRLCKVFC